jgi:hypothetical protein
MADTRFGEVGGAGMNHRNARMPDAQPAVEDGQEADTENELSFESRQSMAGRTHEEGMMDGEDVLHSEGMTMIYPRYGCPGFRQEDKYDVRSYVLHRVPVETYLFEDFQ